MACKNSGYYKLLKVLFLASAFPAIINNIITVGFTIAGPLHPPSSFYPKNTSAPLERSYFSSMSAKRSPSKLLVPYWLGGMPSLRTMAGYVTFGDSSLVTLISSTKNDQPFIKSYR